ncbi:MAG: NAD(P)H-hydrate dehydratase [Clostridia bacterium]|nr:NAD(P)H-hydrate dehydratase [Clostridia bacterium]
MKVYTVSEIRRVEERENEVGIRFIRLMENAGAACAKQVMRFVSEKYADVVSPQSFVKICVVCGKGKNGGDGFVIARKLVENGYNVSVVMGAGAPAAQDAVEMYEKAVDAGVRMLRYDRDQTASENAVSGANIIVDCIFGIGFHGAPDYVTETLFSLVNTSGAHVIAVDVPSGVDSDKGTYENECVRADLTLAITTLKPAHVLLPSREFCGEVQVLKIGISEEALLTVSPSMVTLSLDEISDFLPVRETESHKNDFGQVLVIAGSRSMPGAACLVTNAAVHSGAGLVTAAFPEPAYPSLTSHTTEAMLMPLPADENGCLSASAAVKISEQLSRFDTVVLGPGLGKGEGVKEVVNTVLKEFGKTIVLDADGLNAISENPSVLKDSRANIIITPHPGEMSRLCGKTVGEIRLDRRETATQFADEYDVTVLLKGAATLVCSKEGLCYVNTSGNPGLAKGGSGDVLSGLVGGLSATGLTPFAAASVGAFIHGCAADFARKKKSMSAMTANDVIASFSKVFKTAGED